MEANRNEVLVPLNQLIDILIHETAMTRIKIAVILDERDVRDLTEEQEDQVAELRDNYSLYTSGLEWLNRLNGHLAKEVDTQIQDLKNSGEYTINAADEVARIKSSRWWENYRAKLAAEKAAKEQKEAEANTKTEPAE